MVISPSRILTKYTMLRKSDKVDAVFIIFENEIIRTPPVVELGVLAPISLNVPGEFVIMLGMTRSEYGFIVYIRFDESTSCHFDRRKTNATNLY